MDVDAKLQQYLLLGKAAKGRGVAELIAKATAEPGLFTFGELLDLPSVQELGAGDLASHRTLLELFCYGTWPDYQEHKATLPPLSAQQELKLKQLTVASLGAQHKVLPYQLLSAQLGITGLRQLEDFLITDCFYAGLLSGRLDQRQACLQVHDVAGRDVRPSDTQSLADALGNWLAHARQLLTSIEGEAADAATASAAAAARRQEVEARQEQLKRDLKLELERAGDAGLLLDDAGGAYELSDDDRLPVLGMAPPGPGSGPGGLAGRSKSRRR